MSVEESMNIRVPLATDIIQVVNDWKDKIAAEYGIQWKSGENDMSWCIMERFENIPEEELVLWRHANTLIPQITVRMSGIHRMCNPFGTEWWISFTYYTPHWDALQALVNGVMNSDMQWIPRLKIPIGSTDSDLSDKLYPILTKSGNLPWQGMRWTMEKLIIPTVMEEGVCYNPYEIVGNKSLLEQEDLTKVVRDYLFKFGVIPVNREPRMYEKRQFNVSRQQQRPYQQRSQFTNHYENRRPYQQRHQPDVVREIDFPPLPVGQGGHIQPRSRPVSGVEMPM